MRILDKITINTHSSIRVGGEKICYFDPYLIGEKFQDADYVFLTHDHYDHMDVESLRNIIKQDTIFVVPNSIKEKLLEMNVQEGQIEAMLPDEKVNIRGLEVEAVGAYNILKPYHPKMARWLGYVVTFDDERIYVAGDTDVNEDNRKVKCDIALVPVGDTYTMSAAEAAALVNEIRPKVAVPTHYGTITGNIKDGERFAEMVDEGIEVVLKLVF